jgi:hypothetical protein
VGLQHTELIAVGADDAYLRNANAMIDSNLKTALLLARIEAGTTHGHCEFVYLRKGVKSWWAAELPARDVNHRLDAARASTAAVLPAADLSREIEEGKRLRHAFAIRSAMEE